jgi:hypothetical protein
LLSPLGFVLPEVFCQFLDRHPIHSGRSLIALNLLQCPSQIARLTYFLHQVLGGYALHHPRLGPLPPAALGFTRARTVQGQL